MAAVAACAAVPTVSALSTQKTLKSSRAAVPAKLAVVNRSRITMSAEEKKQEAALPLASLALLAAVVVPEAAEAAVPGVSPSLKNLLLSVLAGGTVLGVLAGAVAGVSLFDPVKRK